jgi:Cu(I)/Ag(I) efflux system membrane fusion protein
VLEPRTVTLGAQVADRVEVREGIAPGEEVVIAGVFLIDSESRMRASGGGTGHAGHDARPSAEPLESAKEPAESGHSAHRD